MMQVTGVLLLATAVSVANGQLHFASLGNWGRNNNDQKATAQTLKANAQDPPLSFIVSPGSNFMEGISDLNDPRWKTQFESIYGGPELHLPFFAALGGTDWDGNVTAMVLKTNLHYGLPFNDNEENPIVEKNEGERERKGPRWTLPNFYYHYAQSFPDISSSSNIVSAPEVSAFFIFIDTKILGQAFPADPWTTRHWEDLKQTVEAATLSYDWVIAVGDGAIYSSGKNGGDSFLRQHLRPLFRDNLLDAYISGHDMNMEIIEDGSLTHITCGSASGGAFGAMTKHDGSVAFSGKAGYCLHTLDKKSFTTRFIDGYSGDEIHSYIKLRNHRSKRMRDRLMYLNKIPKVAYRPLPPGLGGQPGGIVIGGRQPNALFVLICGTIGLLAATGIFCVAIYTMVHRVQVYRQRGGKGGRSVRK